MSRLVGRWCLRTSETHKNTCKPELKQLQAIYDNGFETMPLKYFPKNKDPKVEEKIENTQLYKSLWDVNLWKEVKGKYKKYV